MLARALRLPHLLLLITSILETRLLVCALDVTAYAPEVNVACPSNSPIRVFSPTKQSLHPNEEKYIAARETVSIATAWSDWIGDGSSLGYSSAFPTAPRVGIALSGGSFRAALYGAGVLNALDARNSSAKSAGTGGLLQVASYMSALSGGSWLTTSLYSNDFPNIPDLVLGNDKLSGWLIDLNLFFPSGLGLKIAENVNWYADLTRSVVAKAKKGIDTSLTDPWSRALSYHFLNQTTRDNFYEQDVAHGAGQLWSEIPLTTAWQQRAEPFPIVLVNSRPYNDQSIEQLSPSAPVYEISPFDFVSFDPSVSAAIDVKYIGSKMSGGKPVNSSSCVTGLDETGFVMGTSSSLFNTFVNDVRGDIAVGDAFKAIKNILTDVLKDFSSHNEDVANYPNPFKQLATSTFVDTNQDWLDLIDGGSNGEVVPLGPMFVKSRELEVIVAVDATADDDNSWPTGNSIVASKNRTEQLLSSTHQQFPPIPDSFEDFVKGQLNQRPTFFGCYPEKTPPEYPMVLYFPNSPPLTGQDPATDTSTRKLDYTRKHQQIILDQTFNNTIGGFTPKSNVPDPNFGKCLQCAVVDRVRPTTVGRSTFCDTCFRQYCYDPKQSLDANPLPNRKVKFVDPDPQESFWSKAKKIGVIVAAVVGGLLLLGVIAVVLVCWGCCCCLRGRRNQKTQKYQMLPLASERL